MKVHVLVAQRKGMYPGEYAPEVLDAISEFAADDNPAFLNDLIGNLSENTGPGKDKEFSSYAVLNLVVPDSAVEDALAVYHDVPVQVVD
jgi:hypothetical protein